MNHLSQSDFIAILESAGIDQNQQRQFHVQFEKQQPTAHQQFLEWLGISTGAIVEIRANSRTET